MLTEHRSAVQQRDRLQHTKACGPARQCLRSNVGLGGGERGEGMIEMQLLPEGAPQHHKRVTTRQHEVSCRHSSNGELTCVRKVPTSRVPMKVVMTCSQRGINTLQVALCERMCCAEDCLGRQHTTLAPVGIMPHLLSGKGPTWNAKYFLTTPKSICVSEIIFWTCLFKFVKIIGSTARKTVSARPGRMDVMMELRILICSQRTCRSRYGHPANARPLGNNGCHSCGCDSDC